MALEITKDNFQREVVESDKPVLIDFWAAWCGPCRMLSPLIDNLSKEVTHVKIGKINVDEQSELAGKYKVMTIPTLILMKDGKQVSSLTGVQSKETILKMLQD